MFLNRLTSYIAEFNRRQEGFVPDIVRLLENMSSVIFYQHMLKMVHSQHRMHGNVYLRVNFTKVQFPLGTVEHWHTTSIGLEQYILNIHHTGHGICQKREERFFSLAFHLFKWFLNWLRCQWIANSACIVMCTITISLTIALILAPIWK